MSLKIVSAMEELEKIVRSHGSRSGWDALTAIRHDLYLLAKAICFEAIKPCEKFPEGVQLSKVESGWMIVEPADHHRVLCQNGEWFDEEAPHQGPTVFTLDEALAAVAKLR